jgi:short-subunit dehydrogenase
MDMANVLITGCRDGIGLDVARRLVDRGHYVFVTVHQEAEIADVRAGFGSAANVTVAKIDIADPADQERAGQWDVDVLINNAAIGDSGPLAEIDVQRIQRVLEINVLATLAFTQKFIPKWAAQKRGRIIFMGSMAGLMPTPFLAPYGMSKFALESVAFSLRSELKPFGIAVVMINPGAYRTGFNQRNMQRKYEWLRDGGLYRDHMDLIKRDEARLQRSESRDTANIANEIVKAVEAKKPKRRYVAPRWQWWFVPLVRRFG